MSKKCYVVGVCVFCLIIFSYLICLGCAGCITLPVITIEWKKIKDASDCCCGDGNGNLWAAISGIASLIMGILAFLAWRQSIKARLYSSFETLYASLLAQQRNLFENPSISQTLLKPNPILTTMINRIGFHFDIVDNQPVTTNFCRCYSNIAKKCSGQTFDFPTISKIWNDFVSQLVYRANFLSCFKFLYNIISVQ